MTKKHTYQEKRGQMSKRAYPSYISISCSYLLGFPFRSVKTNVYLCHSTNVTNVSPFLACSYLRVVVTVDVDCCVDQTINPSLLRLRKRNERILSRVVCKCLCLPAKSMSEQVFPVDLISRFPSSLSISACSSCNFSHLPLICLCVFASNRPLFARLVSLSLLFTINLPRKGDSPLFGEEDISR